MDAPAPQSRVLIIDDDPSLRRLMQVIFERDGFGVTLAREGSEGVQLALMNPPNIIVLDIMMEGLHGYEVCKMMRANLSLEHTAIIIISGKSFKPDIDKAFELGADAYIIKPFSPKELLKEAIHQMHKREGQP